jgi:hypothetical protein
MKKVTLLLLFFISTNNSLAQNLNVQQLWGSYYAPENSQTYGLKEDKFGNLYGFVIAYYYPDDYMNSFITENAFYAFDQEEYSNTSLVFKLSPQGDVLWSTFFPGTIMDIAFPADGQGVYFCGGGAYTDLIASENAVFPNQNEFGTDSYTKLHGFLAKFDTNGQKLWGTYLPPAYTLETDESGYVYVSGITYLPEIFSNEDAFDPNFIFVYNTQHWTTNSYLLKMNPQGELVWSTYYGLSQISDIAIKNNELYVSGKGSNTSNYYATEDAFLSETGGMFLSKFNTDGQRIWSTYYGENLMAFDNIRSIKITPTNKILIAGITSSSTGIATTGAFRENKAGNYDYFIAQFDIDGNREWGTYYGGNGHDENADIFDIMDVNSNYIFACGSTKSSEGVATTNGLNTTITTINNNDAFINIFDYNGNRLWGSYYGGYGSEFNSGVLASIDGNSFYHYGTTTSPTGIATPNGAYPNFNYYVPPFGNTVWNSYIAKFSTGTLSNPSFNTNEISLFPNPNNGSFTLSGSVLGKEIFEMQLYNMQGQQLVNRNLPLYEEQNFNFSSYLKSGIYILKLQSKEQKTQKEFKFIVK